MPALSTVVYKSVRKIPRSNAAPRISLNAPAPAAETNSRMLVSADVSGSSFNEVTFYAKVGNGDWKSIGTDDTRPYRVFHDVYSIPDGKAVAYRAVVRDNAGHTRVSGLRRAIVPPPELTIKLPAEDAGVFGTIEVRVLADPERASHVVRIQRRLDGGPWQTVTTDSSSPIYSYLRRPVRRCRSARPSSTGPSSGSRTAPGWSARSVRSPGLRRCPWWTV